MIFFYKHKVVPDTDRGYQVMKRTKLLWSFFAVVSIILMVVGFWLYEKKSYEEPITDSDSPEQVEAQNALREQVAAFNETCPVDMGMMGEISKLTYNEDDAEVVMTLSISKSLPLNIEALNKCKNTLKRSMMGNWAKSEDVVKMMKLIAEANSRFAVVFRSANSQGQVKIEVTESELNDLAEGKVDPVSPREMLSIMVITTNAMCPQQVDEVTTLNSVTIEGTNFVYNYSIDERQASMEALEANKSMLKANIIQLLSSNDPTVSQVVITCKQAGMGILYKYVGDTSGRVCTIRFSPSEL